MDVERMNQATDIQSIIVTGGVSDISRAFAEELAGTGVHVVLADR
jgi:NADP-dependent 3-hydroxy acid dehydrogenase YdfG